MAKLEFRTLDKNEIECRVSQICEKNGSATGVVLLLYKNARVDQTILDEAVGPLGWQREHSRDNRNCKVSIWDEDKKQWVSKEDTGNESYSDKEKGLASDSFKRACFNWGIGRELYTAPFIFIPADKCVVYKDNYGNLKCNERFIVAGIKYDERKNIVGLGIKNQRTGKLVYYKKYNGVSWEDCQCD